MMAGCHGCCPVCSGYPVCAAVMPFLGELLFSCGHGCERRLGLLVLQVVLPCWPAVML